MPIDEDADYILTCLLPEWVELFKTKRQDYANAHHDLGARAEFVGINRKVVKLRRAMWDGVPLVGEQPREVLMDLIGHCFLAIDLIDEEANMKERLHDTGVVADDGRNTNGT